MKLFIGIIRTGVLLFLIVLQGCTFGGDEEKKRPRLGIDPAWYPLNFGERTPYINGFVEELLLEMATHEGIEFERIPSNWDTLFSGLHNKKYDAILTSLPPYSYNLAKYDFSQNFLEIGPVFIVAKESPLKKLDQIKGGAVGIISQDPSWMILQNYPNVQIMSFPTIPDLLNAIVNGDVEGALLERIFAMSYVSDLYVGKLKIVSGPLTQAGLHLITEKGGQEDLVEMFNESLKFLQKKKKLQALLQKWSLNLSQS